MDSVYEDIVKRDSGTIGKVFPVLSIVGLVIFGLIANVLPILMGVNIIFFTGMLTLAAGCVIWVLNRKFKTEFEISLVNDQLTATRIIAMSKREELMYFTIRDCEFIGPVTSDRYKDDREHCEYAVNCTETREPQMIDGNWYMLINNGGSRYMLIFRFNEDIYPLLRRYNPRATVPMPELIRGRKKNEDNA